VANAHTNIVLHQYKDTTELPLDFLA